MGAARSIVIDEQGTVLAGNATVKAAQAAGMTRLRVIDADGDEVIAVRRSGLTPAQKTRLALADNRAAELAEWDTDVLAGLRRDDGALLEGLWSADELAELLRDAPAGGGLTDPDEVPPVRATEIALGQMFQLGGHRLRCGSSTEAADVAALLAGARPGLMVTDPPYGVAYDPAWREAITTGQEVRRTSAVRNDDAADWSAAWALFPGDVAYVWHADRYSASVHRQLAGARLVARAQIIWRKRRFVVGRGNYHFMHEPCWYAVRAGKRSGWTGSRAQRTVWDGLEDVHRCPGCSTLSAVASEATPPPSTVWDIGASLSDGTGTTTHSTQKPVECMARPMRNHAHPEVYEPFSGSGSAIIAAETLSRRVYAMELDPAYVQQAIDRWEAFTGQKAQRVA